VHVHVQDKVVEGFSISLDRMKEVSRKLTAEFKKGLAKEYEEGSDITVRMLITYVHALPNGSEKGDFLALDLGGSNFRVLLISKHM
jgi:hexokinase